MDICLNSKDSNKKYPRDDSTIKAKNNLSSKAT